jgi:FKBP-type peptidyl-prolyl cis-trans isomerase 2
MKEGDTALIDFVAKNAAGEVFDTTIEAEAKKAGVFNEKTKYKPLLVAVGKGMVLKGLDEALLELEEGRDVEVTIPKEKAFGDRREDLVRLVPLSQFQKQDINPVPGMVLDVDGLRARIQSVSGGRVRVDFNHELAGQELKYRVRVLKTYSGAQEKVSAAAKEFLGMDAELAEGGVVKIAVDEKAEKKEDYLLSKARFIDFVLNYVHEAKKVLFLEEYARK